MTNGVPMVVTRMFADQPENARRIEALGCGIALPEPDAPAIRAAHERTLSDTTIRVAADKIPNEVSTLLGFAEAALEFERLAGHSTDSAIRQVLRSERFLNAGSDIHCADRVKRV